MAAVVRLAGTGPQGARDRRHPAADEITVDETGHLILTAGDGRDESTVAVYAPGVWASAELHTEDT